MKAIAPLRLLLLLSAFALSACVVEEPAPRSGSFSVLSYNVHGLPSSITGDDTDARLAQIAPRLDAFDVVGLQEDWIPANHQVLEAASSHPTRIWFDEPLNADRVYGAGVALFAPWPEVSRQHVHYTECNGVLDGASDCLASKGLQAVRLELAEGVEVDFLNTHLEAGGGDEDDAARVVQIEQVVELLQGWSAERPVIFTGDFNLHVGDDPDDEQLDRLIGGGGLSDGCEAIDCVDPTHIDRVFFRDSSSFTWTVEGWEDVSADFLDDEGVDLSDHPPIRLDLAWDWSPPAPTE
jgi:endonuclease/exonuclease/phosphatase family metal-dependent hydrolase